MTETTSDAITYRATASRPSTCLDLTEHPGAVDVDVRATLPDGTTYDGEITLSPSNYDGTLEPCGPAPDYWISGKLLQAINALDLPDADYRSTLQDLAAVGRAYVR